MTIPSTPSIELDPIPNNMYTSSVIYSISTMAKYLKIESKLDKEIMLSEIYSMILEIDRPFTINLNGVSAYI